MSQAAFNISGFAMSDFSHPLLKRVRFVFADDKPNGNNQGIEHSDFAEVKQSAINMPIKMRYMGEAGAGGHLGSVTMGHIVDIEEDQTEDGTHRLIANGVLYASEYPKEIAYLENALAEGTAPGASWEVVYKDVKTEGPVSWLKKILTSAATFVRNPAYGTRTALLALASADDMSDEKLFDELVTIANEIRPKNTLKGGSNKVEEELEKVKAELAAKIAEIEVLTTEKETLATAKAELESEITSQKEVIDSYKRSELVANRTAKVAEAGLKIETDPEKLAAKQDFWVELSENAFNQYVADLKEVKPVEKVRVGLAGLTETLPRLNPVLDTEKLTINDLKETFRQRNRGPVGTSE